MFSVFFQMEKINIATITKHVLLDKSKLTAYKITKEELIKASPKIVQKSASQYVISLWGIECAVLGSTMSKGLAQVCKLDGVSLKM